MSNLLKAIELGSQALKTARTLRDELERDPRAAENAGKVVTGVLRGVAAHVAKKQPRGAEMLLELANTLEGKEPASQGDVIDVTGKEIR